MWGNFSLHGGIPMTSDSILTYFAETILDENVSREISDFTLASFFGFGRTGLRPCVATHFLGESASLALLRCTLKGFILL